MALYPVADKRLPLVCPAPAPWQGERHACRWLQHCCFSLCGMRAAENRAPPAQNLGIIAWLKLAGTSGSIWCSPCSGRATQSRVARTISRLNISSSQHLLRGEESSIPSFCGPSLNTPECPRLSSTGKHVFSQLRGNFPVFLSEAFAYVPGNPLSLSLKRSSPASRHCVFVGLHSHMELYSCGATLWSWGFSQLHLPLT